MNIQELQTLKTTGLNIIIIILNNKGYLSIWQTHENFFGRVIGATPSSGVEFPNFKDVGQAYGIQSEVIVDFQDMGKLERLLDQDGPLIIDMHVDPRQEFSPRIKSRVDESGKFITPELDDMHPFLQEEKLNKIREDAKQIKSL